MSYTRDDVLAAVQATFQDSERTTILALLDRYGTEPYECERERVQLAIVELSGGSTDTLTYMVQTAKTDYRDVLAWKQLAPLSDADGEKLQNEARTLRKKWSKK